MGGSIGVVAQQGSEGAGKEPYVIPVNDSEGLRKNQYPDNFIRTSRYTILTFIPKNLFEQFRRFANFYFLLNACFSLIPDVSPISPVTSITPLVFVLFVAAVKDGIEDYHRHTADREANSREYQVLLPDGERVPVPSADIVVGDIVYLTKGQEIPADLVLLASSGEGGNCYTETSNLDGESNLKRRVTPKPFVALKNEADVVAISAQIECEPPTEHLYKFEGKLKFPDRDPVPLSHKQLLLRGAKLRNTRYVYGVVVYAGSDTKLYKNLRLSNTKFSHLERRLNRIVLIVFVFNMALLVVCAIFAGVLQQTITRKAWYFEDISHQNSAEIAGLHLLTYFILFTYLIPISLFVTVELVRVAQAQFMVWDVEMASDPGDVANTGMLARNSNMNEELGEIGHVFSDKTGTLTENVMKLVQLSIAGNLFDLRDDSSVAPESSSPDADDSHHLHSHHSHHHHHHHHHHDRAGRDLYDEGKAEGMMEMTPVGPAGLAESPGSVGSAGSRESAQSEGSRFGQLGAILRDPRTAKSTGEAITMFLRVIALCNTVVPEVDEETGERTYEAQSPDEGALVEAAAANGVTLLSRLGDEVKLDVLGVEETYTILATLEFTPDRKRMSVIVRLASGAIELYIKGADSVIFNRKQAGDPLQDITYAHVHFAARLGLRTLVVGYVPLSQVEFLDWKQMFDHAETQLVDRDARVAHVCDEIEQDIRILGCTAVEDKLQKDVPETIHFLLQAGLKVWLLTGDKQETAENIGFSSSLLSSSLGIIRLNAETRDEAGELLDFHLSSLSGGGTTGTNPGLVVDGHTLELCLVHLSTKFWMLGERCSSVICCRVTPKQKADVLRMVKERTSRVCLAIGDGANDVSMIQEADVGIGIRGREGTQAVRASDFAFNEFRFLRRLLVVHGRYSLIRLAGLIQYSFYKNIAYIFPQFYFGFYSAFSGQPVYDEYILSSFNIVWAASIPLFIGIFEKDLDEAVLEAIPSTYRTLKNQNVFNARSFSEWVASALYHATISFSFVALGSCSYGQIYQDGRTSGLWVQTTMMATCGIITTLLKAGLYSKQWNVFHFVSIFGSILLYACFILLYTGPYVPSINSRMYGVGFRMFQTPVFWFTTLLTVTTSLIPDVACKFIKATYSPYDWHVLRRLKRESPELHASLMERSRTSLADSVQAASLSAHIPNSQCSTDRSTSVPTFPHLSGGRGKGGGKGKGSGNGKVKGKVKGKGKGRGKGRGKSIRPIAAPMPMRSHSTDSMFS